MGGGVSRTEPVRPGRTAAMLIGPARVFQEPLLARWTRQDHRSPSRFDEDINGGPASR